MVRQANLGEGGPPNGAKVPAARRKKPNRLGHSQDLLVLS